MPGERIVRSRYRGGLAAGRRWRGCGKYHAGSRGGGARIRPAQAPGSGLCASQSNLFHLMLVGYVLKHHEAVGVPQVLLQFLKGLPLGHDLGVLQELSKPVFITFPVDHRTLHGCPPPAVWRPIIHKIVSLAVPRPAARPASQSAYHRTNRTPIQSHVCLRCGCHVC
jgi:hypothetical protein